MGLVHRSRGAGRRSYPTSRPGILEWNEAFELAGFRNAVQVRRAPTEEADSSFSLLDARFSVVRYNATPTRSANAGADVVDPRSGEAIRSHMNIYHGLSERMRWQLVSQVATANPQFQTQELTEEDLGEAIRYVVSHESAHAIGLPHNQRANFVYPVESIRDPAFVARMGALRLVGRPHPLQLRRPARRRRAAGAPRRCVGQVRGPVGLPSDPRGDDADEEELPTLDEWIVDRAADPWYRFGAALFGMDVEWDPHRMTEGISDDPVQAAVYGMRNLYAASETLMEWVLEPGRRLLRARDPPPADSHPVEPLRRARRGRGRVAPGRTTSATARRAGSTRPSTRVSAQGHGVHRRVRAADAAAGRSTSTWCAASSTPAPSSGSAPTRNWRSSVC